jgi:hypothetical protein
MLKDLPKDPSDTANIGGDIFSLTLSTLIFSLITILLQSNILRIVQSTIKSLIFKILV